MGKAQLRNIVDVGLAERGYIKAEQVPFTERILR